MQRAAIAGRAFRAPAMGTPARPSSMSTRAAASPADTVRKTVADNKVVVYSKTTCPYCSRVKGLFSELKVPGAVIIELDQIADGPELQASMMDVVGRKTVPQVFIGGKHVGGCDDTMAAYDSGKLKEMFAAAGISI